MTERKITMYKNKMEWAYQSMACYMIEKYRMPGVDDAFAEGSECAELYREIWEAYGRLRDRLDVQDEDKDVETIINAFEEVQRELCYRMYHYGAVFGE